MSGRPSALNTGCNARGHPLAARAQSRRALADPDVTRSSVHYRSIRIPEQAVTERK